MRSLILGALCLASYAFAFGPHGKKDGHGLLHPAGWEKHPTHAKSTPSNITFGNSTFEQYIDHNNPSLGKFSQFYYWSSEFWAGPGSPYVYRSATLINHFC